MKKIIAREFLLLASLMTLTFLFYLLTFPYKYYYYDVKIDDKKKELDALCFSKDSLNNIEYRIITRDKEIDFDNSLKLRRDIRKLRERGISNKDILKFSKDFTEPFKYKKTLFNTPTMTNEESNLMFLNSFEENNKNLEKKIRKLYYNRKSKMSHEKQINDTILFFSFLLIPFYFLRYFYQAIKWSIKTIREKK